MTGPEHYREAERLTKQAHHYIWGDGGNVSLGAALAAEAQVHATLALAAATALSDPSRSAPRATVPEWDAWQKTAGVPAPSADYDVTESIA